MKTMKNPKLVYIVVYRTQDENDQILDCYSSYDTAKEKLEELFAEDEKTYDCANKKSGYSIEWYADDDYAVTFIRDRDFVVEGLITEVNYYEE